MHTILIALLWLGTRTVRSGQVRIGLFDACYKLTHGSDSSVARRTSGAYSSFIWYEMRVWVALVALAVQVRFCLLPTPSFCWKKRTSVACFGCLLEKYFGFIRTSVSVFSSYAMSRTRLKTVSMLCLVWFWTNWRTVTSVKSFGLIRVATAELATTCFFCVELLDLFDWLLFTFTYNANICWG